MGKEENRLALPLYGRLMSVKCFRACLRGGKGLQIGEVTCGGSTHLSSKRDQTK